MAYCRGITPHSIDPMSSLDLITGVSALMIMGAFSTSLVTLSLKVWAFAMTVPMFQSFVNTTLVALEFTEDVWKPVLNVTALVLKPLAAMSLALFRPLGPYALVVLDQVVKGMVVFGYATTLVVRDIIRGAQKVFSWLQGTGISVQMALMNAAGALKDLATSLVTLTKAAGYIVARVLYGASYIVNSFERVGSFMYTLLFEAHTLTWEDVYNVSIPFVVVGCIVAYCLFRSYKAFACARPSTTAAACKKSMFDVDPPRRSTRLARKRAMLYSDDLCSGSASCKKAASCSTNL